MIMEVTRDEFDKLAKSVDRIERALLGDEGLEIEGMAKKVNNHEKYIAGVEKWRNKGVGMLFGFSVIATGIYELLVFLIHKINQ